MFGTYLFLKQTPLHPRLVCACTRVTHPLDKLTRRDKEKEKEKEGEREREREREERLKLIQPSLRVA